VQGKALRSYAALLRGVNLGSHNKVSMADLRERFYDNDDGRAAIRDDVARFADGARSPRRLLAVEERYGSASAR